MTTNTSGTEHLSKQWECARHVYAWHQVFMATQHGGNRGAAKKQLEEACQRFVALGGEVMKGVDVIGHKGPLLKLSDGREVPYGSGIALVDDFAQQIASGGGSWRCH